MLMKVEQKTDVTEMPRVPVAGERFRPLVPVDDQRSSSALVTSDYLVADGVAKFSSGHGATYEGQRSSGLFTHPAWLKAYNIEKLVIVEAFTESAPDLIFSRVGEGLFYQGRLLKFDPALISTLSDRLMATTGASFVVFEDVEIAGQITWTPRRAVFHYQNNWRLPLEMSFRVTKRLATDNRRKTRGLLRDRPIASVQFRRCPDRSALEAIGPMPGIASMPSPAKRPAAPPIAAPTPAPAAS